MPMRRDCKHYETRTYASGETVHMCRLDLAPDAPWRCPDDCPKYEFRGFDAGWTMGSLARKKVPEEPPRIDEDTARLLDQAEDIINAVGPEILEQVGEQRVRRTRGSRLRRLFRRRRR